MKVAVIGYSGAGKSTLARALGERYGIPVLHLDGVHHAPGWQIRDRAEARRLVLDVLEEPSWVIDGNYTGLFYERRIAEADQILFLDLPRLSCLTRVVRRFLRYRGRTREDMAEGCPEKLDLEFVRWILWDGRGRQKKRWLEAGLARRLDKVTVLKSQRQIDRYWEELSC